MVFIMKAGYQKYDDGLKEIIIKKVKEGHKPSVLAEFYNVSAPLIRYWVKKAETMNEDLKKISAKKEL